MSQKLGLAFIMIGFGAYLLGMVLWAFERQRSSSWRFDTVGDLILMAVTGTMFIVGGVTILVAGL